VAEPHDSEYTRAVHPGSAGQLRMPRYGWTGSVKEHRGGRPARLP